MAISLISVALGGAFGASLRYLLGLVLARGGFPIAVLTANVIGSFVMGLCAVWLMKRMGTPLQLFLMTGVLGGFTTFSAFSLETLTLMEKGEMGSALLYIALSIVLCLVGIALAMSIARALS